MRRRAMRVRPRSSAMPRVARSSVPKRRPREMRRRARRLRRCACTAVVVLLLLTGLRCAESGGAGGARAETR